MAEVFPTASLYVGDLDSSVGENDLMQCFSTVGPVCSVRVCRDSVSHSSLRYGYVNFFSRSDALRALQSLNYTKLKEKRMRIMWSQRNPQQRKNGVANLFIKNLDPSIDSAALHEAFAKFGNVLSCKVAEENGKSKGFGYVQLDSEEAAQHAVEYLHGNTVNNKKVYVSKFVKKSERQMALEEPSFTNVYVNNLDRELTENLLKENFSACGRIKNAAIMKDDNGQSRGFGFVCFESPEDAKKAVQTMNGAQIGSKKIYAGRAQKKCEREKMLKKQFEERFDKWMKCHQGLNVYVKNLNASVDDHELEKHFSICGKIMSAKVMRDDGGFSRKFGFVCFSTPDDAYNAVCTLNGTMFHDKLIYVAIAQRKEDRQIALQNEFAENFVSFPNYTPSSVVPCYQMQNYYIPMDAASRANPYHYQHFSEAQAVSLPLSHGQQGYETALPHGFSSKQMQQKQMGDWVNGINLQYNQQAPLFTHNMQHDLVHPVNFHGLIGHQPVKYNSGNQYPEMNWQRKPPRLRNENKPASSSGPSQQELETLRMKLTDAEPKCQKRMIRDYLLPLVQKLIKYEDAAEITRMLLEINQTAVLYLLDSPESLVAHVHAAGEVLKAKKAKKVVTSCGG